MSNLQFYKLKQVSELLGIGIRTLRKYINAGDLKAKKIGRNYFVTGDNLVAFMKVEE